MPHQKQCGTVIITLLQTPLNPRHDSTSCYTSVSEARFWVTQSHHSFLPCEPGAAILLNLQLKLGTLRVKYNSQPQKRMLPPKSSNKKEYTNSPLSDKVLCSVFSVQATWIQTLKPLILSITCPNYFDLLLPVSSLNQGTKTG